MDNSLAIIIPAYKGVFFRKALESIACQTCKDFTLYIGDDASPDDLESIISEFYSRINIVYHRFESNLGGTDLVAHWHRCVSLIKDEKWLWLFSDDDLMGPECVSCFYNTLKTGSEHLYHIDLKVIDQYDKPLHLPHCFPQRMGASELFAGKIKLKLTSTIVEYIFSRELFMKSGGFEHFDLAWGSDDATWIKMIRKAYLSTIKGCWVYWRYSTENISASLTDPLIISRKVDASVKYLKWVKIHFAEYGISDLTTDVDKYKWMLQTVKSSRLCLSDQLQLGMSISQKLNYSVYVSVWGIAYLIFSRIKYYSSRAK